MQREKCIQPPVRAARSSQRRTGITIPTGLRPPAQGCEIRATLGKQTRGFQPQRGLRSNSLGNPKRAGSRVAACNSMRPVGTSWNLIGHRRISWALIGRNRPYGSGVGGCATVVHPPSPVQIAWRLGSQKSRKVRRLRRQRRGRFTKTEIRS